MFRTWGGQAPEAVEAVAWWASSAPAVGVGVPHGGQGLRALDPVLSEHSELVSALWLTGMALSSLGMCLWQCLGSYKHRFGWFCCIHSPGFLGCTTLDAGK